MTHAALNQLDQLYLHLDRADEPWGVHFEIRVDGPVDAGRLAAAIETASERHPIARARLAPWRGTDLGYRWEIADASAPAPLEEADGDLATAREAFYARAPSLEAAPPFGVLLAHDPGGDSVLLNLHHAAGDGMSAARLMLSIVRAYAGDDDPVPDVDPLAVRDVRSLAGSGSLSERVTRLGALGEHMATWTTPTARVTTDGGRDVPGYGFELLELTDDETRAVIERRRAGGTVNDVLLGGLAVAIRRWNAAHDRGCGRIALMMPVNVRPPEWRTEVLANYASYVTVSITASEHEDLDSAIAAAAERTRRIKEAGTAGLMIDLLEIPSVLPAAVKRRLQDLIPLTGNLTVDTAVLSNLGRLDAIPDLGADAGAVRAVWFSPPGRMPLGTSFGAATLDGRLFLTLRYRHAQFDAEAASAFAAVYRDALLH
jgi:NRPS condensation-like uncharacterized protein